jgi:hypothetical protein
LLAFSGVTFANDFDILDVSWAVGSHAVALFVTAVLSPKVSLLAGVSAVAATPTAADVSSAAGVSTVWRRCCWHP